MAEKPNLFSRLFRSTKENLKKQKLEKKVAQAPNQYKPSAPKVTNNRPPLPKKTKIPLSGGKIETYQTCPRKFQYTYLRRVKQGGFSPSPYLSFDGSLHNTLKFFYKYKKPNETFRLDNLLALLNKNWDNRGYESIEQEQEFKTSAENALRLYFATFCSTPPHHIEVDYFFKIDLFGGEYTGKIDRIDKDTHGNLEIIDYKTGKSPLGGVSELSNKLSVQLLFLAADTIWPGKVKKVTFIYLKEGISLSVPRDPNNLATAKKQYLDLGENIYQGKFAPIRSSACGFCDFQDICPIGQIPSLNPTKVRTFLECPKKYSSIYVKRNAKRSFDMPGIDLLIDRPLHDALAAFHRDYQPSPNREPQAFLFSTFFKAIPKELSDDVADQLKSAGREYLDSYLTKFFPRSKTFLVNEFIDYSTESFNFQITIDRIDKLEDGTLELIDYKSGKRILSQNDIVRDPVILASCAAAAHKWPGKVAKFTLIFLRHGESVSINLNESIIKKGNQYLFSIGDQIKQKNFDPLGGPACATCPASDNCGSRRLALSMSKLQTLRDCPKKYEFRYIKKAPVPEKEKPALVLYQLLQSFLHDYVARKQLLSNEEILKIISDRVKAQTDISTENKEDILQKAYSALINFNESIKGGFPQVHSLGENVKIGYENVVLTARFDRIDILPNGNFNVIIYKTSKRSLSAHEARLDLSGVYNYFVAERLYPGRIEQVIYHYLLTGDKIPFKPSSTDIEKLKLTFNEFVSDNSNSVFEGHRNPLCPYCDYVEQCEDAQRLLLSPSKINSFTSCALKYKLKYIDRVPKDTRPTPNLSFDRSIHFTLREFHEFYSKKQFPKNPFRSMLNKYWIKDGYNDVEEEERFKVRANMMLEDYYNKLTGEEKAILFEATARWTWNNMDIVVQIDRVDELEGGKFEIIDYKTGKKVPDERVLNEDSALLNMYLAANQRWPGRVAKVSYYYLSNGKKYSLTPTEEDINNHKIKMAGLVDQINKNEFESNKGALCAWCEFYGPCPEWKVKPHEMVGETQEQFRQRIRLSYSKMSLYLNCPRSYKKLYIDKVPPKPQPFFSFGTTIHETFERVYDPINPMPKPSLEKVLQIYDEVRLTHREGFASDAIEEQYRQDGIKQITMYYNRFIAPVEFKPAYSIEDYFEIPCGKYAVMTGFIDRIDKLDDGTYEILDYKTEPTMRSQEAVDNDKQLSIYYWACEDTLGLKISKLSLLMLDHDCKLETSRTRDDIPKVIEAVDKTAYEMIHETEFAPRKNKYCKSCDHLHDCPLKNKILQDESLISMKKF